MLITEALRRNVTGAWGADGERWLAELPDTLAAIAADWGLRPGPPFDLSYHYVAPATAADGTAVVLKLGVPSGGSLADEAPALEAFAGRGSVRLVRRDLTRGALLLERAEPGTRARDLVPHDDAGATAAALAVMRELHVPFTGAAPLPPVLAQANAFDEHLTRFPTGGPLPRPMVEAAAALHRDLCASAPPPVLLHGDLHHDNVLSATRAPWLSIDPHGKTGDPAYEVGSWLFNPDPGNRSPSLTALVPSRIEQLADGLGQPIERVRAWGFVKSMLSDVWTAETWTPGDSWSPASRALDVATLLYPAVR